jgi:mannan endo-1,4-beta-mannosidase
MRNLFDPALQQAVDLDYPLIIGEFSQFGDFPCGSPDGTSMCSGDGEIDYQIILSACDEREIGWYTWEWGPGNGFFDPLCAVMDMTPDQRFANLKPGWAREVALDSPFSIKNTSVTPASI